jgi:DNA topoisomerase IB
MIDFGHALPSMRETCLQLLDARDMNKERVLACATRLLDLGFFRIGSEGYAEENQTYGLATIRKRHVKISDGIITFDYVAKSGKRRIQSIVDPAVCEVVVALKERKAGGPELLAYEQDERWVDVKSADINAFIKDISGADFTAKDFRTWNATVLCAVALAVSAAVSTPTGRKRAVVRAVHEVSHYLGNTPAVCRASYIDPRVFDRYSAGVTIAGTLSRLGADVTFGQLSTQGAVEEAVLDLLADEIDERGSDIVAA